MNQIDRIFIIQFHLVILSKKCIVMEYTNYYKQSFRYKESLNDSAQHL